MTASKDNSYTTYEQCYTKALQKDLPALKKKEEDKTKSGKKEEEAEGAKNLKSMNAFFKSGGYKIMKGLEEEYKCASVCYKPLFYLSQPISEGPVQEDCATAALQQLAGKTAVGVICTASGVLLFLAWLGGFTLCCPSDEGEMSKEHFEGGIESDIEMETKAVKVVDVKIAE